jgi:excinuclease ABC subunit A
VLVVEHNLDVIQACDWLVDIGPEGGSGGGLVVAEGTPEQVARAAGSHTGRFLRAMLGEERGVPGSVKPTRGRAGALERPVARR